MLSRHNDAAKLAATLSSAARQLAVVPDSGKPSSKNWKDVVSRTMIIAGRALVETFFAARKGHKGIKAALAQYDAWLAIAAAAEWRTPEDVKASHPKASILKGGRVVFNIKANDFRLVALVEYRQGVLTIRFFGTHAEYDEIDAETV